MSITEIRRDIIVRGEAALARLSPNNPMRPVIERNVREARAKLAGER